MTRHSDTSSAIGLSPRAGLLIRRGRVVAMASALAVVPMVTGVPQVSSTAPPHPVQSHSRQIGFVKTSSTALQAAGRASSSVSDQVNTPRVTAVTPVQDVAGAVTVVGVTWATAASSAKDTYQIRTLTGSLWGEWQSLVVIDGGPGAGPAATTGTDPYIVTGASKYEVRSLTTGSTVPAVATVQAIDPGTSSADDAQEAPGAAAAATAKPAIHTRAQWGADESKMTWDPSYGKVSLGFVHHTDGTNNYTQAEVPGVIRGIYQYHAVQMGWGDIGYNFLVDRFGGIWEGRYGGMDKPVIGGQVYNYNSVSTGVSGLGTFTSAVVPQAMTDAFKRVLAWRLSVAGIPATGNSPVRAPNGTPIQRIAGHRDAGGSTCPGNSLYARLGEIRAAAAAIMARPSSSAPPAAASRGAFSPGDFTGDRKADVLAITSAGDLYLYRGNGTGGFTGGGTRIGAGWGIFTKVFSTGDFTGDGRADILGVKSNGDLILYRGNGVGGFTGVGTKIGFGWGVFAKVFSTGDFTGDGRADILGINSNGHLVLYRGNGRGGFTGVGTKIGAGWNIFPTVFAPGDFSGDGRADILGINSNGDLILYRGNGRGGFTGVGTKIGFGWNIFR